MTTGGTVAAALVMVGAIGCTTEFPDPCEIGPAWEQGFGRRRPISITNPGPEDLAAGFQVQAALLAPEVDDLFPPDLPPQLVWWDPETQSQTAPVVFAVESGNPRELWFPLQGPLVAGSTSACSYLLYYEGGPGQPEDAETVFDRYAAFGNGNEDDDDDFMVQGVATPGESGLLLADNAGLMTETAIGTNLALDVTVELPTSAVTGRIGFETATAFIGWDVGEGSAVPSTPNEMGSTTEVSGKITLGTERFENDARFTLEQAETLASSGTELAHLRIAADGGMVVVRVRLRKAAHDAPVATFLDPQIP